MDHVLDYTRDMSASRKKNIMGEEYSEKNPKIDLYHKETGKYLASTNWSPTNIHAVSKYEEKNPHLKGLVRARRTTK